MLDKAAAENVSFCLNLRGKNRISFFLKPQNIITLATIFVRWIHVLVPSHDEAVFKCLTS